MTGEEFIKDICNKAQVENSELVNVYNYTNQDPDTELKSQMFRNMIDSIIKVKEENNSVNNPYVDCYAALVCIERLSSVIDNIYALKILENNLDVVKHKHNEFVKEYVVEGIKSEVNNE